MISMRFRRISMVVRIVKDLRNNSSLVIRRRTILLARMLRS